MWYTYDLVWPHTTWIKLSASAGLRIWSVNDLIWWGFVDQWWRAGIWKSRARSSQSSFSHQRPCYCKDKGNPIKWGRWVCSRFSLRFTDSSLDGQIESKESVLLIATGRVSVIVDCQKAPLWRSVSIIEKQMKQVSNQIGRDSDQEHCVLRNWIYWA